MHLGKRPAIQLVLDYSDDVAERQALMSIRPKKVAAAA
jgi:hypothetical protein